MQMERERNTCMQEGGQRRQKKRQQTKWIGKKAHTKKYIIRTAHRTGDGRNGNDTLHDDGERATHEREKGYERQSQDGLILVALSHSHHLSQHAAPLKRVRCMENRSSEVPMGVRSQPPTPETRETNLSRAHPQAIVKTSRASGAILTHSVFGTEFL